MIQYVILKLKRLGWCLAVCIVIASVTAGMAIVDQRDPTLPVILYVITLIVSVVLLNTIH